MAVDSEKAVGALKRRAELRRQAQEQLRKVIEDAGASSAQKTAASRALLLDTRSAKKRQRAKSRPADVITGQDVARMRERLRGEPGMELFSWHL